MLAQNDPEGAPEERETGPPKENVKETSKLVRVMTVMAYLMSVSMAAILLSIYYLCIWKSPTLRDIELEDQLLQQHLQNAENFEYQRSYMDSESDLQLSFNFKGGSSTTIDDTDVQLPLSSSTYPEVPETSEIIDITVTESTNHNHTLSYNGTAEVIAEVSPSLASANESTPLI